MQPYLPFKKHIHKECGVPNLSAKKFTEGGEEEEDLNPPQTHHQSPLIPRHRIINDNDEQKNKESHKVTKTCTWIP